MPCVQGGQKPEKQVLLVETPLCLSVPDWCFVIIQGCFYGVSTQGLSRLRWCNWCIIIVCLANDHAVPKRLHRERKKYIPEWTV